MDCFITPSLERRGTKPTGLVGWLIYIMKKNRGHLVIISSPSGGGKNSVINALMADFPGSTRLVTTTTRPMRPGERDGLDYYFISEADFKKKLAAGDFLEHNNYAGHWYGTDRKRLEDLLQHHQIVFSQIEVNGKHQLTAAGVKHLAIFLLPESMATLKSRIEKRGGLSDEVIAKRLNIAETEMEESKDYDYRLLNKEGKIEETVAEIRSILKDRLGLDAKPKV